MEFLPLQLAVVSYSRDLYECQLRLGNAVDLLDALKGESEEGFMPIQLLVLTYVVKKNL